MVTVKVTKRFHDMAQKQIREKGEVLEVPERRGRYLISQGMVEEYVEPKAVPKAATG